MVLTACALATLLGASNLEGAKKPSMGKHSKAKKGQRLSPDVTGELRSLLMQMTAEVNSFIQQVSQANDDAQSSATNLASLLSEAQAASPQQVEKNDAQYGSAATSLQNASLALNSFSQAYDYLNTDIADAITETQDIIKGAGA